jgi:CubicO group peptidase (beta-lactamase class C family)
VTNSLSQKHAGAAAFFHDTSNAEKPPLTWAAGFAKRSSVPVSSFQTPFLLASVSKTITYTALTILLDEGKFKLDDDVSLYLDQPLRNPSFPNEKITFRMFYTHRTSMKNFAPSNWEYMYAPFGTDIGGGDTAKGPTCPFPDTDLESFFNEYLWGKGNWPVANMWGGSQAPFQKKNRPGTKMVYSNLAAAFVAVLVERISGVPFDEFCQQRIFNPLGMQTTAWHREDLPGITAAMPYQRRNGNFRTGGYYCFLDYPNGGLWSTANDVAKFDLAVARFGVIEGENRLYSEATGRLALECADSVFSNSNCEFGLGWGLESSFGPLSGTNGDGICYSKSLTTTECKIPMHDGAETGVETVVYLNPNKGYVFGVLTNSEGGIGPLAQRSVVAGLASLAANPPTIAPLTGAPTKTPTEAPTQTPTEAPTKSPTQVPTPKPTKTPTTLPTGGGGMTCPVIQGSSSTDTGKFDWGVGCASGDGCFTLDLPNEKETKDVGLIPAGKFDVYVRLEAVGDIDITLYDIEDTVGGKFPEGRAVVAWCSNPSSCNLGVLGSSPYVQTATYQRPGIDSIKLEYSGYNGQNGNLGDEYIRITGATTTPLMMRAFAYKKGAAKVTYSWGESQDDCCLGLAPCGGVFTQEIAENAILEVGEIPKGKLDVTINLKTPDNSDVDIQLYDLTACTSYCQAIIAWCNSPSICNIGLMNGPSAQSEFYPDADGLEYSWTGYNGQNGNLGDETISIAGETDRELMMKVFGYTQGKAEVAYSYWNPVK